MNAERALSVAQVRTDGPKVTRSTLELNEKGVDIAMQMLSGRTSVSTVEFHVSALYGRMYITGPRF